MTVSFRNTESLKTLLAVVVDFSYNIDGWIHAQPPRPMITRSFPSKLGYHTLHLKDHYFWININIY